MCAPLCACVYLFVCMGGGIVSLYVSVSLHDCIYVCVTLDLRSCFVCMPVCMNM